MKTLQVSVAVVTALLSSVAFACSCALKWDPFPRDGSVNVPTNVVLHAMSPAAAETTPETVTLMKSSTQESIELTATPGPGPFLRTFTPKTLLEPMTQYVISIDDVPTTFTTGEGEDHDAPSAVVFEGYSYKQSGTPSPAACGITRVWSLTLSGGEDAQTPREQVLLFAQTSSSDDVAASTGVTTVASASLRAALCGTDFQPPDGSFPLAFQAMDLAGNVSQISKSKQASSCSSAPELFAVLAVMMLVRKRR